MRGLINRFADENCLIAGVCDGKRLIVRDEARLLDAPFIVRDINRRLEPGLSFAETKSIIVIGLSHNHVCGGNHDPIPRGRIARYAIGEDYHESVAAILEKLAAGLGKVKNFGYRIFVDKNALCERALAVKAGLGYIGKNQAVISEKLGSYFNIGCMLTDLDLEPDIPSVGLCPESCSECIRACPGGALSVNGFDYRKCVSYLTQKKGDLEDSEIKSMGAWIYGCDICQEVCPANRGIAALNTPDGLAHPVHSEHFGSLGLNELIHMNDHEFKTWFGGTALFWRGRETIVRNAMYAKRNT